MAVNLDIRLGRPAGSRIVDDYFSGAPALGRYFAGSAWDAAAYRRKAAEVDTRFSAEQRTLLGDVLRPTSAAAAARIDQLAAGNALCVTTGQQAGLFTGPLFTIYKILSAIRLAEALEGALQRPVLPIFWVASDDHDWAEIDHAHLVNPANELVRVNLPHEDARALPAGERVLGPGVEAALAALEAALPFTGAPSAMALARSAYTPDRTASGAFTEMIATLFADFDLAIVDPRDARLKRAAAPLLQAELTHAAGHEERLGAQTARLVADGYHAQVAVLPGEANVFMEQDGARERLVRSGDDWMLKGSAKDFSHAGLGSLLEREPQRFSPNVFLRPVVESALLPTVAYVGGPAELSYFAQIGCLFRAHNVGMPVFFPRFSVTLVEAKIGKVLDKFGLDVGDFRRPAHELESQIARDEIPTDVRGALQDTRKRWTDSFAALEQAAAAIDPTLKGPISGARNAGFAQLGELEKKIAQAVKRQNATTLEQVEKAAVNLHPDGAPQERVLNVLQYYSRYGEELLPAIAECMQVELGVDAPAWAGVECA